MSEPDIGLSARLRRLPGQLLLALVNATVVLVIVAAILALLAVSGVQNLAANVATTMTDAVLSRLDTNPQKALADLQAFGADIRGFGQALKDARAEGGALLAAQVDQLDQRLADVQAGIRQLSDSRSVLIDQAMSQIGIELAKGFQGIGACPAPVPGTS